MKKFTFIIIGLLFSFVTLAQNNFPQGAWKLIQQEDITDGTSVIRFPEMYSGFQYKIWSEGNWMFFIRWNQDNLSGDGYGGGTYTINGNQYTENILYHANQPYEGRTLNMTLELINDTLVQTYHPVDSAGHLLENTSTVEKFIRME